MLTITFKQTAPWNPALRNGYRDRYAEAGGRYFKISAESLESMWWVEEVDADGEPLWDTVDGEWTYPRDKDAEMKFGKWAYRLSDARTLIATEIDRKGSND